MAVIFYLSGSGNSLYAARQLAEKLEDCRLETIGSYLRKPYDVNDEVVGVVSPVYCFALPPMMAKFLEKLQAKPNYCFGVVTMGGNQGRALKQMSDALAAKKITLNYAQAVLMPDNFFGIPLEKRLEELKVAEPVIAKFVGEVAEAKADVASVKEAMLWKLFGTSASWWYLKNRLKLEEMTVDAAVLGDKAYFLIEESLCNFILFNGEPIDITLPTFIEKEIVETEPGVRGDTATNVTKPAKIDNGFEIQVPIFINQGDIVKIDTRTGTYAERVSKK